MPNDVLTIRCTIDLSETFANQENLERIEGEAIASHAALSDFEKLLSNGTFSDFTIKVGGSEIKVHRCMLAARSDVMAAMLNYEDLETATNTLEISDFEYDVVFEMLRYIYTGKSSIMTESESSELESLTWDLLRCSEKYQLHGLKTICQKELIVRITPKNAVESVKLADFFHAGLLLEASINFIAKKQRSIRTYSNVEEELAEHPEIMEKIKLITERAKAQRNAPVATSSQNSTDGDALDIQMAEDLI